MIPPLLDRLLSLENQFNELFAPRFPLYKFPRLYEDRRQLTEDERESSLYVENADASGYHILNAFLVSLLREHAIWFAPSSQFNDPWDAGSAISVLANSAIEERVLRLLFGETEFVSVAALRQEEGETRIQELFRGIFSLLRFSCFTRQLNSNPMWAHYADNHRGVCLEFQFVKPLPDGKAYGMDRLLPDSL